MAEISLHRIDADRFRVTISGEGSESVHIVNADIDRPATSPEDLVEASIRFLLDREPRESILPEFDLGVISRYFPEYHDGIEAYLG